MQNLNFNSKCDFPYVLEYSTMNNDRRDIWKITIKLLYNVTLYIVHISIGYG